VTEHPDPPGRSYKRLSPLTPLVRSAILVVAVVASSWNDVLRGDLGPLGWVLLAMLVAGAAYGTASWFRTKYWIEADELRVDTGVISRQSRRIRVDRLQGIDIVQPFVARLLGLAELRMDVAGGGSREGSLAFLPLREAHDLRATLLARRDAVRAGHPAGTEDPRTEAEQRTAPPAPEQVVARLDLGMLVVSLLLSPETGAFLVSAAFFIVVFATFGGVGGAAGVVSLVVGLGLTQFRKLSAYYDFTVAQTAAGLQVRRGLFDRSTQTITLARVQGVVISEPLLWRGFGWARLDVAVAGYASGSADGSKPSASTVLPVGPRPLVMWLARHLLQASGGPDPDAVALAAPPVRARWVAPWVRRFLAAGIGEDLVVSRAGLLSRRTHVVPHARVQSLRLHQGPWQRRLGLADVLVDSPPGPVHVRARHRDVREARALLDEAGVRSRAARSL